MNRKTLLLLLGVLIIAGALRLYHLPSAPPGLYPDEAMNGSNALEAMRANDFQVFYRDNGGREGLFINIQALSVAAFGKEPWALRLPSALFGILTVLALFLLARELFRKDGPALLAALFLAISFWHINFSRIGFRAITASFFLGFALYFFLRSLRDDKGGLWFAAAGGLFFGLGFYSYLSYRVMPLLFLLFIPFFWRRKDFWLKTGLFIMLAFLAALPLGKYFLENPADFTGRTSQISIFNSETPVRDLGENVTKTIGMLNVRGDGNWRHNLSGRPALYWPVGILFWIGFLSGIREIFRNRRGERLQFTLLVSWLLLAAIPVVVSNEGLPHALRAILMLLPLMIFAARGGEIAYAWLCRKWPRTYLRAAAAILLAALTLEVGYAYFYRWAKEPETASAFSADTTALGQKIQDLPADTPKYIIIPETSGTPIADPLDGKVRNLPIHAQTVIFLTDSFSTQGQRENRVYYRYPHEAASIPPGSQVFILP